LLEGIRGFKDAVALERVNSLAGMDGRGNEAITTGTRGDFELEIIEDPEANGFVRGSENVAVDSPETGNESEIDQGMAGGSFFTRKRIVRDP
jgi:hypothetical protein